MVNKAYLISFALPKRHETGACVMFVFMSFAVVVILTIKMVVASHPQTWYEVTKDER